MVGGHKIVVAKMGTGCNIIDAKFCKFEIQKKIRPCKSWYEWK